MRHRLYSKRKVKEYLEKTLYNKITAEFGQSFREEFEKVWKQFLDECFVLWSETEDDLKTPFNIK